jgi:O-succinylbenzoic acid--CoA ligase
MKIVFDSVNYPLENIGILRKEYPESLPIIRFIERWKVGADDFEMQTSGSSGAPKKISVTRKQILASVEATKHFLNLESNDIILLSLDPQYIASLMMVARALVLDMDILLIRPAANPLKDSPECDFASFVPFQLYKMIAEGNVGELKSIKNILIGGAPLSQEAFELIAQIDTNIYITYGMTETVSHVALMPVKGQFEEACFRLVAGIEMKLDEHDCINLKGAVTGEKWIETNDVAQRIDTNSFRWLGRRDLIINSGGVKIHPESLEILIHQVLSKSDTTFNFFISYVDDALLGQKCVLVVEGNGFSEQIFLTIKTAITTSLSKYHVPQLLFLSKKFTMTDSGKIKRGESLRQAQLLNGE